jgi:hypothetical protein
MSGPTTHDQAGAGTLGVHPRQDLGWVDGGFGDQ